ncbi:Nicotinate phosphoribosyltransferase pncB2 [Cupriavidus pinatubonensis]|uniref:Nicotinate phosphoribosyltransferase n=2 Tax=Cupriavidus pinatubonensis TaxID=248026 RepID=A0ABN7ZIK6_9BURK|nr:nicotinate phosphoribosyltransferase [Cupriavidus pinatubonensis]CAG9185584.1 Nicotinate phosphoribosyltransferase pncB2 [Cupriavidus pinatubonensis]
MMSEGATSESPLLTDLYEFTMMQAYFDSAMNDTASFEFFVRKLPPGRNFLMAAGLEQVLVYLENLTFSAADLSLLKQSGHFSGAFLRSLEGFRFCGEVAAMPEGTVFFPDEPILRITAPIREAQLVESRVMNLLHYETIVASKAARVVLAGQGRTTLVDFGLRRAHGAEAGLLSARASYLAGFTGTATLLAGARFGIPTFGTMAHSYVQAHSDEQSAFESFARSQPDNATLLIDTYDTEAAAQKVAALAVGLRAEGIFVKAVRLDSGDLGDHARKVRAILDGAGLRDIGIFASGNLDEYRVRDLLSQDAPIDGFGVGTRMNTSADSPYLDCAYKLTEYAGLPRRKRSEGKATWPGRKQSWRRYSSDGNMCGDTVTLDGETCEGTPLMQLCMVQGRRLAAPVALSTSRGHAAHELAALPPALRKLEPGSTFPVTISPSLIELARTADALGALAGAAAGSA